MPNTVCNGECVSPLTPFGVDVTPNWGSTRAAPDVAPPAVSTKSGTRNPAWRTIGLGPEGQTAMRENTLEQRLYAGKATVQVPHVDTAAGARPRSIARRSCA